MTSAVVLPEPGGPIRQVPGQVVEIIRLAAAQAAQLGERLLHALGEHRLVAVVGAHAGGDPFRAQPAAPDTQRNAATPAATARTLTMTAIRGPGSSSGWLSAKDTSGPASQISAVTAAPPAKTDQDPER